MENGGWLIGRWGACWLLVYWLLVDGLCVEADFISAHLNMPTNDVCEKFPQF